MSDGGVVGQFGEEEKNPWERFEKIKLKKGGRNLEFELTARPGASDIVKK